jgi:hypothetical protein
MREAGPLALAFAAVVKRESWAAKADHNMDLDKLRQVMWNAKQKMQADLAEELGSTATGRRVLPTPA